MAQPKTKIIIDEKAFNTLLKTMKSISILKKGKVRGNAFATELPLMVGLKLTNRCNLRCTHCYEWSETGYLRDASNVNKNEELDFSVVKKVIEETHETKSTLYLWGGEPLVYRHFGKMADLLEKSPRIIALCTNGIFVEKNIDSIIKMGKDLDLVIALEGFREENDSIRGKGTYDKVFGAIDTLLELRKKNIFTGNITIHTVINGMMYDKLYRYAEKMERAGIDSLLFCFPWYISDSLACEMDTYFEKTFDFLNKGNSGALKTWHFYKYGLSSSYAETIMSELDLIIKRPWNIKVRYVPAINRNEIYPFLEGKHILPQNRTTCSAIALRMDVLPDGSVSSCKHFPEFTIGSLKESSVYDVWNNENFRKIRKLVSERLMPICSQCNNLYIHGE